MKLTLDQKRVVKALSAIFIDYIDDAESINDFSLDSLTQQDLSDVNYLLNIYSDSIQAELIQRAVTSAYKKVSK